VPAHYEPVESPVQNPLYRQQSSPVAKIWERPDNRPHAPADHSLSLCADDLSSDRAPCGRHTDALGAGHRRIAAGGVCRNLHELADALGIRNSTGSRSRLCGVRSK